MEEWEHTLEATGLPEMIFGDNHVAFHHDPSPPGWAVRGTMGGGLGGGWLWQRISNCIQLHPKERPGKALKHWAIQSQPTSCSATCLTAVFWRCVADRKAVLMDSRSASETASFFLIL